MLQVANMLYLEAPAGVGYSYSDDGNYTTNDDVVSNEQNFTLFNQYARLLLFFGGVAGVGGAVGLFLSAVVSLFLTLYGSLVFAFMI